MKLPNRIKPCPIIEAIIEIRFIPSVPAEAIFGLLYSNIKDRYSKIEKLPILELPEAIRNRDINLKYKPYHKLLRDKYTVMIGPRVLSIAVTGNYPGWNHFYPEVDWIIQKADNAGIFNKLERYSLRYINFFDLNIFNNIRLNISLSGDDIKSDESFYRTTLSTEDLKTVLQISNSVSINVDKKVRLGSIIDIDVSSREVEQSFIHNRESILNKMHTGEKKVFFNLLTESFLKSFNPEYD